MTDPGPERLDGLADLVAVMDRLRSPGGCPWDAEQDHRSLLPYAVEEVYEVVEAVESGDRAALREELGDLLLQVVFHARVATEHPDEPFDIDDVAAGVAEKLRRRHPHVFGDVVVTDAEDVHRRWDHIKRAEKARDSAFDGVPTALPALARAQKILSRARRAGLPVAEVLAAFSPSDAPVRAVGPDRDGGDGTRADVSSGEADVAAALLAVVAAAERGGVDAESALRRGLHDLEQVLRRAERPSR